MAYDEKTTFLGLPLPHPRNTLREDCPRIRESLQGLDGFAKKTDASLSRLLETDTALAKAVQDQGEDLTEAISRESEARSQADSGHDDAIAALERELANLRDERLSDIENRFSENGKIKAENLPLTDAVISATGTLAASDTAVKTLNDRLNSQLNSPADSRLWIGVPRPWRSTALPPNHCWANGDFVAFADWPELAQVYEAGGFKGLLLDWDADGATQAANLGKWRPDAAEPTGLYTPDLSGQFLRCWVTGSSRQAGAYETDQMRVITGTNQLFAVKITASTSGCYEIGETRSINSLTDSYRNHATANINTALLGEHFSGDTTHPENISQPHIIYLGNPA